MGRNYEWRILLAALGADENLLSAPTSLGFDLAINDKDDDGFSWVSWGGGIAKTGRVANVGDLIISTPETRQGTGYAFGLGVDEVDGRRQIGHGGGDAGFRTYVARFPEERLAGAIFSNLASFDAYGAAMRAVDIVRDEGGEQMALLGYQLPQDEVVALPPAGTAEAESALPDSVLADYLGIYFIEELQTRYTIVARDGQLVAVHPRHSDDNLTPVEPDHFAGSHWWFASCALLAMKVDGFRLSGGRVRNLRFVRQ